MTSTRSLQVSHHFNLNSSFLKHNRNTVTHTLQFLPSKSVILPSKLSCSMITIPRVLVGQSSKVFQRSSHTFFRFFYWCVSYLSAKMYNQVTELPTAVKTLVIIALLSGFIEELRKIMWDYFLVLTMMHKNRFKVGDTVRIISNGKMVTGEVSDVDNFHVSIARKTGGVLAVPNKEFIKTLENLSQLEVKKRFKFDLVVKMHLSETVEAGIRSCFKKLDEDTKLYTSNFEVRMQKFDGEKNTLALIASGLSNSKEQICRDQRYSCLQVSRCSGEV